MSKIKNYIDALNVVSKLIVTDSVSDNDIEMYANVIYSRIMEHDSPDHAAGYVATELFKKIKAEKERIACNFKVERSTMMADRYILLIKCIYDKLREMQIPIYDEQIYNFLLNNSEPQHEELPEDLKTVEAKSYLQRLVDQKFCDTNYHWNKDKTNYQAAQAAHHISWLLWKKNKWNPFEKLWGLKNMASTFNNIYQANKESIKEIDDVFPENAPPPHTKFK